MCSKDSALVSSAERLQTPTKRPWEIKALLAFLMHRTTEAPQAVITKWKGEKQLAHIGLIWEGSFYKAHEGNMSSGFQSHDTKALSLPTGIHHFLSSSQKTRKQKMDSQLPQKTSQRFSPLSFSTFQTGLSLLPSWCPAAAPLSESGAALPALPQTHCNHRK